MESDVRRSVSAINTTQSDAIKLMDPANANLVTLVKTANLVSWLGNI